MPFLIPPMSNSRAITMALLIATAVLATAPEVQAQVQQRVITSWTDSVKQSDGTVASLRYEISYNYLTNQTIESVYDASGSLLSSREIEGAPQPNDEEIAEAIQLIRADPELSAIVNQPETVIDGGFLLYEGDCAGRRCMQFEIGAADGTRLERFVVVELSERVIVERDLYPHLRD